MARPAPSGSAAYKKKDGTLVMSKGHRSISWIPAAGGAAGTITIPVGNITNLQQTPASNPKVMLKIFVQQPTAPTGAPEPYVFAFTAGPSARQEADAIKDALSAAIQAAKALQTETSTGKGMSAAMAIASAVSSAGVMGPKDAWDDDNRLKSDAELQQSLLKADPNLQLILNESMNTKPDTLSTAQFMAQFWSTRLHLLRAHAIERAQTRGSYNVLSTLKPRVEANVTKLNIRKEHIQLIFTQHPLVKRAYDENVPKLSEQQFWSRFFQSRLFKKLRGERISEHDPTDAVLDKYLQVDEYAERERDVRVPHFLDLAGNEVNHSQRQGNRPDLEMRPSAVERVPIIRTLNRLSERIMSNVAPTDPDPSAPSVDDEALEELKLRDLRGEEEQQRILLNIRDRSRFLQQGKGIEDEQSGLFAQQDPEEVMRKLRSDVRNTLPDDGSVPLDRLIGLEEGSENEDGERSQHQVGPQAYLQRATSQILEAIQNRRAQTEVSSTTDTYGLSDALYDRLTLTHATTTEFLHQFWQAFLSGNPDRAGEVASLVESLNRAMDRIKAVASDAEGERRVEVDQLKRHAREVYEKTGKKLKVNLAGVPGGEKVVNQLLGPLIYALETALAKYQEALAEEMNEMRPV